MSEQSILSNYLRNKRICWYPASGEDLYPIVFFDYDDIKDRYEYPDIFVYTDIKPYGEFVPHLLNGKDFEFEQFDYKFKISNIDIIKRNKDKLESCYFDITASLNGKDVVSTHIVFLVNDNSYVLRNLIVPLNLHIRDFFYKPGCSSDASFVKEFSGYIKQLKNEVIVGETSYCNLIEEPYLYKGSKGCVYIYERSKDETRSYYYSNYVTINNKKYLIDLGAPTSCFKDGSVIINGKEYKPSLNHWFELSFKYDPFNDISGVIGLDIILETGLIIDIGNVTFTKEPLLYINGQMPLPFSHVSTVETGATFAYINGCSVTGVDNDGAYLLDSGFRNSYLPYKYKDDGKFERFNEDYSYYYHDDFECMKKKVPFKVGNYSGEISFGFTNNEHMKSTLKRLAKSGLKGILNIRDLASMFGYTSFSLGDGVLTFFNKER